jgi:hypothetical protein
MKIYRFFLLSASLLFAMSFAISCSTDDITNYFKDDSSSSGGSGTCEASSSSSSSSSSSDVEVTAIANGTYYFYPRPRAIFAGRDINAYVDKIVVRSGYFNVYIVGTPSGDTVEPEGENSWANMAGNRFTLQDLDRPRIAYTATNGTGGEIPRIIGFQDVTGKRFKLTYQWPGGTNTPHIFEEINMDEAEHEPL